MSNSATSLSESAALSDPFAEKEVKDESPQTSSDSTAISSEASSDAVTTTQASASLPDLSQRPSSHATQAETIENTAGWTDPLSSDNGSSNPQSASNNDQSYSAPSQHEVSDALTTGLSNANEASATTVATVANAGGWNSFSSGSSSTSGHPPDLHAALGSAGDPAPDAFDEEIDRKVDVVNDLKDKLKDHLPHNDVSDELTDEGIAVVRGVAHQENHILNDAESAMHDSIFGNAPSNGKLNSDIDRLVPTMFESLPAYQQADKIRREALDVQNVVTRTVNSVSCMFSFDPYCK
jgi:hypothetical protein